MKCPSLSGLYRLCALMPVLVVASCASLPSTGPSRLDIALEDPEETGAYSEFAILPLSWENVEILGTSPAHDFGSALGGGATRSANAPIGDGDSLVITVWEASADGLFSSAGIKQTKIDATVDSAGAIFVPYAGKIDVAGLSVEQVRLAIARELVGQAVEPQIQVALAQTDGNMLSVVGDVVSPGQFTIPTRGLRLVDAIALARGPREAGYETEVTVQRAGNRGTVRLEQVLAGGPNNIYLSPGDTVQLRHQPRSYTAFGAVTSQNLQAFQSEHVTLAEALAQTGGLNDNLADAGGVFLFRYETEKRLNRADVTLPKQRSQQGIPTIYRLDFTTPDAFFLATSFEMRDDDIIYVANAPATEFKKFATTVLSPFISSVSSIDTLSD